MIVAEYHFGKAIVRIHDDYIEDDPTPILKKIGEIKSQAYMRILEEKIAKELEEEARREAEKQNDSGGDVGK